MTDQPLGNDELDRLRDGGPDLGPPCSDCDAQPQLMSDGIPHVYHAERCTVAADIQRMIDDGTIRHPDDNADPSEWGSAGI